MTLRIHNISYDHSQEFRTYPAGVLTIDTLTRTIHVHDGLTPNGWGQPTNAELGNYALKDLTNVTQESMNNALNTFGALNMNNADQVSTTQRDNAWTKLFGPAMLSNADIPDSNYLYVDKKDRKMKAGDVSAISYWGIDFSKGKFRQLNSTYSPSYPALVIITGTVVGGTRHTPKPYGVHFYVDNVDFPWSTIGQLGGAYAITDSYPISISVPVVPGQNYKLVADPGFNSMLYQEFPAIGVTAKTSEANNG
jgi:hypothetical protein